MQCQISSVGSVWEQYQNAPINNTNKQSKPVDIQDTLSEPLGYLSGTLPPTLL